MSDESTTTDRGEHSRGGSQSDVGKALLKRDSPRTAVTAPSIPTNAVTKRRLEEGGAETGITGDLLSRSTVSANSCTGPDSAAGSWRGAVDAGTMSPGLLGSESLVSCFLVSSKRRLLMFQACVSEAEMTDLASPATGNIPEARASILVRPSKISAQTRQSGLTRSCALIWRRESFLCFIQFLVLVQKIRISRASSQTCGRQLSEKFPDSCRIRVCDCAVHGLLLDCRFELIVLPVATNNQNASDAKTRTL